MKKVLIVSLGVITLAATTGCSKVRRSPGSIYAPDMTYSRAYETYAGLDSNKFTNDPNKAGNKIFYNHQPVEGTIAEGGILYSYPYKNDSAGYAQSAKEVNPLDVASLDMKEAERLYLINCGICHGSKLDGNGPLWKGGDGPYPAAPKNFMDAAMKSMPEGTMYHSVTYGKNTMGSYASQLTVKQRWEVIAFIKQKQGATGGAPAAAKADSTTAPKAKPLTNF